MPAYWLWIAGSMVFYGLGEWGSKKWIAGPIWSGYLILLFTGYTLNLGCWLVAFRGHGNLAILGTIYGLLYSLVTIVISQGFFREQLTVLQWIGIALALIAVGLLGYQE